jgi:alpha-2-macroglobulin
VTDAYWYLYAYPFECAEQRSGRMLATSALYDILDAFATPGRPTRQQVEERRATDLKQLARDQAPDGGWGFFRDMASDPYVTMQVLHALAAHGERNDTTRRAATYVTKRADSVLAQLAKQARSRDVVQVRRPDDAAKVSLAATALSVLAATGTNVTPRALRLHALANQLASYPVDAKARVLAIVAGQPRHRELRDRLVAELLSVVHETAAAATVAATYTDAERMLLVSTTKTTALVLDALLRETPQHALITKLARGLLDSRRGGRWRSTQDNLVALQAIRRYFDIYEQDTPTYTGKLWLGTAAFTEHAVAGRSTERATAHATWSMLEPGSTHDIALSRAGTGRMYFRIGITYAPKDLRLPPLDAGFVVRRSYRAVDDPADVMHDSDGRVRVKLGARVLVQLEAINTTQRHGVALVDPLPAGFEAVNTRLATSERAVVDPDASRWDHTNMRDNRSEVFAMELAAGVHRFSYTARATTPGTFMAAPAKAEEMYSPETFGRSAGSVVIVE